jgi:predicted SAM-dependent methyltransferase
VVEQKKRTLPGGKMRLAVPFLAMRCAMFGIALCFNYNEQKKRTLPGGKMRLAVPFLAMRCAIYLVPI